MAFTMEVLDVAAIKNAVQEQVKPEPEEVAQIKNLAEGNAAELMKLDLDEFAKRKDIIRSIESFGADTMKRSAAKSSLLKATIGSLSKDGDEGGVVATSLVRLNREIKDLDPSPIDFVKRGILGKYFNPIRDYFARYERADSAIADIVASLDRGKIILKNDNTTLDSERQAMRDLTKQLMKEIELGTQMDAAIEKQIEEATARDEDPEKIQFASDEILFPLRQRVMDLQQMVVVNQQGVMATTIVIRNNKELMRGVERAKNVTISALTISVMVAKALYDQKIAMDEIGILNATTNNILVDTSKKLKGQGSKIQEASMQPTVSVEDLKAAFVDVMEALDAINAYKQEALPKMRETINQFKELAAIGEEQIEKLEKGEKLAL